MKNKKLLTLLLAGSLLAPTYLTGNEQAHAAAGVQVEINGQLQNYEQPPVIINGRTLVPLRAIFETLGAELEWDPKEQIIDAYKNGQILFRTQIGWKGAYIGVDQKEVTLETAPTIINGRTMVPVRFVAEAAGAQVNWNANTRTVIIDKVIDQIANSIEDYYVDQNTNYDFPSAIVVAAENGNLTVVKEKLSAGVDPNIMYDGKTALIAAAQTGRSDIVQTLLEAGADFTIRDEYQKNSPLFHSIAGGHVQVADLLFRVGAKLDKLDAVPEVYQDTIPEEFEDYLALKYAITQKNKEMAKLLLANGVSPNAFDGKGKQHVPLHDAIYEKSLDMVQLLLEAGAEPNTDQIGVEWNLPLTLAIEENSLPIFKALLEAGADPNAYDGGSTMLMWAIGPDPYDPVNNEAAMVKLLLDKGADPNGTVKNQSAILSSPLDFAIGGKNLETITALLDAGADPNILISASKETGGDLKILKLLLEAGADPNQVDEKWHVTPMFYAKNYGYQDLIDLYEKY